MDTKQTTFRPRPDQDAEEPCFHCLDTGWFMLTAENDFGELEDYFVLSGASAKRRSEGFGGGTRITGGGVVDAHSGGTWS